MSRLVAFVSHSATTATFRDLAGEAELIVVGPPGEGVNVPVAIANVPGFLKLVASIAERSVLGRNMLRVTPLDMSRRVWHSVRRDARIDQLLATADVVVAGDRDAILTVWKLSRRRAIAASCSVVYGVTAGRFALSSGA